MIHLPEVKKLYKDAFGSEFDSDRGEFLECLYKTCIDLQKPARVLEVGTYQGKSAFVMACALHGTESNLICIDPIFIDGRIVCTDAHHAWSGYDSNVRDVLCRLSKHNLAHLVSIVPGFSEWVFDKWDGRMFDMCLVDGAHTTAQVALDSRWSKYVKSGGYMLFDDWIGEVRDAALAHFSDKPNWQLLYQSTSQRTEQWAITAFKRNS